METDDDHATMRESFSLVQNILFIGYTNILPFHQQDDIVEKLWETMQIGLFFLQRTPEAGTPGVLVTIHFDVGCHLFVKMMIDVTGKR